jgi:uncharacterized protein YfdQ (DUF2303 family)
MDPIKDTNAAAIIEVARLAERSQAPTVRDIGGASNLIYPDKTIKSLEYLGDSPRRKRAIVLLQETASFIDYVNRHKLARQTHIFGAATENGGGFTAVLDYHKDEPPIDIPGAEKMLLPSWGEHEATLKLETTVEWNRWIAKNGKLQTQEEFAEFIEDNLNDIVRPDGASVLEIAQGLQGRKHVTFKSGKNLRDGAINFEYVEQVEVQGTTSRRDDNFKVPDKFTLGIVPFVGAEGIEIDARLRFRIGSDGKLSFAYVLNRPFKVIQDAFLLARGAIEQATGIRVMLGRGVCITPSTLKS